ncbi:MAG: hypothetical protein LBC89_02505 [Bacteroidales bacterium]|jgi:cytochrome bd-type quinol oxidase subunit 1|nr:hypothetical protein [Bacteroidales bacterium]
MKKTLWIWGSLTFAVAIICLFLYCMDTKITMKSGEINLITPYWILELFFISGCSLGAYWLSYREAQVSSQKFIRQYQMLKYIKLFLYLIVLALWAFLVRKDTISFLILFMVFYLIFAVLETILINRLAKKNAKKEVEEEESKEGKI